MLKSRCHARSSRNRLAGSRRQRGKRGASRAAPHSAALALLLVACGGESKSVLEPEREETAKDERLLVVTGRVGTAELTALVAEPLESPRTLATFALEPSLESPLQNVTSDAGEGSYFYGPGSSREVVVAPGGRAALVRWDDGTIVLDLENGNTRRPPRSYGEHTWAPDGRMLAIREGKALIVFDTQTGTTTNVVPERPGHCIGAMQWSPDGKRLAYLDGGDCESVGELHVVGVDGSDDRVVFGPAMFCNDGDHRPSGVWSPDGAHLAFFEPPARSAGGSDGDRPFSGTGTFHVVSADGTGSPLSIEQPWSDYDGAFDDIVSPEHALRYATVCAWSPRDNVLAISARDLRLVDAERRSERLLDTTAFMPSRPYELYASLVWAPDGAHLTRISHDGREFVLRTVSTSAGEPARDVPFGGEPFQVAFEWSSDGRRLLHHASRSGEVPTLTLSNMETGEETVIANETSFFEFNAAGSRFLHTVAADAHLNPGIVRDASGQTVSSLPAGSRGWLGDASVVLTKDGHVTTRPVDRGRPGAGSDTLETSVWSDTEDERLLFLHVPRPIR